MSDIGTLLDDVDAFDALEDDLTVHNYVEGSSDGYGDAAKSEHPDSPVTVRGSVDIRGRPSIDSESYGIDVEADVIVFLPDETFVTTGDTVETWNGHDVPFPTEVDAPSGTYHLVHIHDEGNGRLRCLGRDD